VPPPTMTKSYSASLGMDVTVAPAGIVSIEMG
jgi:hypothetical protein